MFCPRCHRTPDPPSRWFCPWDGAILRAGRRVDHLATTPVPEAGKVIAGRYVIRGLVGQGGMSNVYLAEDRTNGEPVALKILSRDRTGGHDVRSRFFREVEVARMLDHPNVLRIVDAGEISGRSPYLVTELLFGESLGELLRRTPILSPGFGIRLLRDAASALGAAHRMAVTHRDVKPDNLFLLGEPGKPYALKVMDFGLARMKESNLTVHGMTVGTLSYMPPEQALGDPVDARADIYALGVVMFRMFTGQLPFDMLDDMQVLAHHVYAPPPPPRSVHPEINRWLAAMILAAMRKHPDNRYPSMDELLLDLDRIDGLRSGEVGSPPMRVKPDVYRPRTDFSREVAKALRDLLPAPAT